MHNNTIQRVRFLVAQLDQSTLAAHIVAYAEICNDPAPNSSERRFFDSMRSLFTMELGLRVASAPVVLGETVGKVTVETVATAVKPG